MLRPLLGSGVALVRDFRAGRLLNSHPNFRVCRALFTAWSNRSNAPEEQTAVPFCK
jgi:hypothetical protein